MKSGRRMSGIWNSNKIGKGGFFSSASSLTKKGIKLAKSFLIFGGKKYYK